MGDEAPGPRWRVEDIQQTTRVTGSGRFEEVYEYTIETGWGGTFRVMIPTAIHSEEVARGVIEAEYAGLERGRFLQG